MKTKFRNPRAEEYRAVDTWRMLVSRALNRLSTHNILPAFSVNPTSAQTNFSTDDWVDVVWGTEVFDLNGDFASNTFTAPVTGYYHFDVSLYLQNLDSAAENYGARIVTSNRNYTVAIASEELATDADEWTLPISALADMDKDDTATVQVYQTSGTAQTDIHTLSYFTGYLVTPAIWD